MYIEGTLAICAAKSFVNDKGETIKWYENHIYSREADGTTEVYKLNSKEDLTPAEGKTGHFKLRIYKARSIYDTEGAPAENVYKISVVAFQES